MNKKTKTKNTVRLSLRYYGVTDNGAIIMLLDGDAAQIPGGIQAASIAEAVDAEEYSVVVVEQTDYADLQALGRVLGANLAYCKEDDLRHLDWFRDNFVIPTEPVEIHWPEEAVRQLDRERGDMSRDEYLLEHFRPGRPPKKSSGKRTPRPPRKEPRR